MNLQPYDTTYQDGLNTFPILDYIDNKIATGGTSATISSNIFIQSSNLYIANSNIDGEIRFKVKNNINNPSYAQDYRIKIDKDGKIFFYHIYNPLTPQYGSGWYEIGDEIIGLKFNSDLQQIEVSALGISVGVIQGQITDIYSLLTIIQSALGATQNGLTWTQDVLDNAEILTDEQQSIIRVFRDNYTQVAEDYAGILDRTASWKGRIVQFVSSLTSTYGTALQFLPVGAGIIGSIYGFIELSKSYNLGSNIENCNFTLTPQMRRELVDSNLNASISNFDVFQKSLSNMSLIQGFANSNIETKQIVPYLRSNKIEIGNITTPNAAYQLEMTGDLNTNMLYINSVSLTSLLNQKQDNLTAVSPIYITTGNIGLTYDSSLTKVGNNLSVVKTATAPLKWTGNDISIDYDNTLLLTSGTLGVNIGAESKWSFSGGNIYNKALTNVGIGTLSSLTSKLTINGDIFTSSNINCGVKPLNFITSFTNSTYTLATGTNEYYLQYTGNGTLVLNEPCAADLLVVGAGGNGGRGASSGGGGAGEVIYIPNFPLRAGTLNINVGVSSTTPANRISSITHSSGTQISSLGGGNGGSFSFYSTSGGTVSALTPIVGTNDAYITITATTTLTLDATCTVDVLLLAGGGGGSAGGGGSGEYKYLVSQTYTAATYGITIGAGGAGTRPSVSRGNDGNDSFITRNSTEITRARKGGGGAPNFGLATAPTGTYGSLGGAGHDSGATYSTFPAGTVLGYLGSRSTNGSSGSGTGYSSAGGGGGAYGAGQLGVDGNFYDQNSGGLGGAGGIGVLVPITGTNTYYGGGGAGGTNINKATNSQTTRPAGGLGGGGAGSLTDNSGTIAGGLNATANTGSGGGGSDFEYTGTSGNGADGVCIIRFYNYLSLTNPTSGGSGGGGAKTGTGASAGVKFDEYKSFVLAGLNGTSTNGGNGGSGNTTYNTRYTTTITGSSLSVGLGGSGATTSSTPTTKTNYGDGGDGNGGTGFQGTVIIRFKDPTFNLHLKAIKDNANTGLIINANESSIAYQLRVFPWSDTFTSTGIATRGYSFRVHDGNNNLDLLNFFSSFGGRIGVKTKNPFATLDVNGDIRCKTFIVNGNELYGISTQITNEHPTGEASINVIAGSSGSFGGCGITYLPADNQGLISCSKDLKIKTGNDAANSYIYLNNTNGRVGIGIANPATKLGVNGTITSTDIDVLNGLNAITISAGLIYGTEVDTPLLNNYNGTITNVNYLHTSNLYINNAIDMQNHAINNCSYLYGGVSWANELKAYTNYYHKDDQGRDRIYFKNDTTNTPPNHFTLFKSGGTTHAFSDKDDVQYCLLERFGLTTYFEVISGGGYDVVCVLDASATGTYVFRKMVVKLSSFTEVHRCFIEDELYNNYDDFINQFIGRVVSSKGKIKTALKEPEKDWEILEGKDAITIDDSHPVIELSRKKKDKAVVGVITKRNQNNDLSGRLVINSLGETACWVVNKGGNIENGDLITTSDEIGYGERQEDDIMRNYTIGKCMIDCSFELDNPNYKCEDLGNGLRRAFLPIFIYSG